MKTTANQFVTVQLTDERDPPFKMLRHEAAKELRECRHHRYWTAGRESAGVYVVSHGGSVGLRIWTAKHGAV